MGINQMEGTPWHIEKLTRSDGDEKRHRSRCKYFNKNDKYCSVNGCRCHGSAHCMDYDEVEEGQIENNNKWKSVLTNEEFIKNKEKSIVESKPSHKDELKNFFEVLDLKGNYIIHNKFGEGKIIDKTIGIITVEFSNKVVKKFSFPEECKETHYKFKNEFYNRKIKEYKKLL